MGLIEVSEKQLLALKAVVHGCNTNKRLVGASYMHNIQSESPEMISYYEAIKTVDEMLAQPTIEAEPVRHGRWERTSDGAARCTACKRKMNPSQYGYAFCGLCGAKMDGGADDADSV